MSGGKKKKQTLGYWYRLGVQAAVCHAPIDKVKQIIFGERTAWHGDSTGGDIFINQLDLFGGEKREGGVKGRVAINMGRPDQKIDRYVAMNRGSTSAQRGLLTLVFGDGGSAPVSNLKAINFPMSSISTYAENRIGLTPTGLLTVVGREMTRQQVESYIGKFYAPKNIDGYDELKEQYDIYGSWRAVALMFTYRAYVVGNLNGAATGGLRFTSDEFFGVCERVPGVDNGYSEPFFWSAMNPYFKSVWVHVQNIFAGWTTPTGCWYPERAAIEGSPFRMDNGAWTQIYDMNPAHMIYNILTNTTWGMGYSVNDIDSDSFKKAADTLFDEKFGMSLAWRREEKINEFINIILKTIDAILRINVLTGKFQLVLIRGGYDISKLPVISDDNILKLNKYERSSWSETPNKIVLTYRDRMDSQAVISVDNLAAMATQGAEISTTVEYVGIHEPSLAGRVAERELYSASTPIAKVSMSVNRMAFLLQVGDVFNFQWEPLGVSNLPLRVLSINKGTYDDASIDIEAVEDIFGLPDSTYVSEQESLWTDPYLNPTPVVNAKVVEAPYYDVVYNVGEQQAQTGIAQGYTFSKLLADMPNTGTPIYQLLASKENVVSKYSEVITSAHYAGNFTTLDSINRTQTSFSITPVENMPSDFNADDYIVIDDEVMAVVSIDNARGVIQVTRGNLDTIPNFHESGTIGWIVQPNADVDETFRVMGENVFYRPIPITPRGRLNIKLATPFGLKLVGRADRPYPPAAVKINNVFFKPSIGKPEDLTLTWNGRNRLMVKLDAWDYGHVAEEPGVTYSVKVYDAKLNKVIYSDDGLAVRVKTYKPPLRLLPFTLPATISGLIYHYNFETLVPPNKFNPVSGSNTGAAQFMSDHTTPSATVIQPEGITAERKAITFTGNQCAKLPFDAGLNNPSLTFGFMLNTTSTTAGVVMAFEAFDDGRELLNKRFVIEVTADGKLLIYIGDKDDKAKYNASFVIDKSLQYTAIVLRIDNTTGNVDCWMNGTKQTTVFWNQWDNSVKGFATQPTGVPVKVGYFNTADRRLIGTKIDDLFVYNRALNDSEVATVNKLMADRLWVDKLMVEMKTVRGGIDSWQTFRHIFDTI